MERLEYLPFVFPTLSKVCCVFTTKEAGDALDKEFKEKIKVKFKIKEILDVHQEHKDKIVFFDELKDDKFFADAIGTSLYDVALMIKTADCQPLLIAHVSQKYIGAFHVGWRANRGEFILKWIDAFCEHYNISPLDLFVVRGPSLSFYGSEFVNFENEWDERFRVYFDPKQKCINLWRITEDQLLKAGIKRENIFCLDMCTYYSPLFFSYRRDRSVERQASLIWIRSCS